MNTTNQNPEVATGNQVGGKTDNYDLLAEWSKVYLNLNRPPIAKLFTLVGGKQTEIDLVECGESERGIDDILSSREGVVVVIFGETLNSYMFADVGGFLEKCREDLDFLENCARLAHDMSRK